MISLLLQHLHPKVEFLQRQVLQLVPDELLVLRLA
jgi:hypothetical protein